MVTCNLVVAGTDMAVTRAFYRISLSIKLRGFPLELRALQALSTVCAGQAVGV